MCRNRLRRLCARLADRRQDHAGKLSHGMGRGQFDPNRRARRASDFIPRESGLDPGPASAADRGRLDHPGGGNSVHSGVDRHGGNLSMGQRPRSAARFQSSVSDAMVLRAAGRALFHDMDRAGDLGGPELRPCRRHGPRRVGRADRVGAHRVMGGRRLDGIGRAAFPFVDLRADGDRLRPARRAGIRHCDGARAASLAPDGKCQLRRGAAVDPAAVGLPARDAIHHHLDRQHSRRSRLVSGTAGRWLGRRAVGDVHRAVHRAVLRVAVGGMARQPDRSAVACRRDAGVPAS